MRIPSSPTPLLNTRLSDFKCSTDRSCETDRIVKLKSPKGTYKSPRNFAHSDFRGLIHADGGEALQELFPAVRMANQTPQSLPLNRAEDNASPTFTMRSASTELIKKDKQLFTTTNFPQPINNGLILPLKWTRKDSLEHTITANFSSWGNLCKSTKSKISYRSEVLQKMKKEHEMTELAKEAEYCRNLIEQHEDKMQHKVQRTGFSKAMLHQAMNYDKLAKQRDVDMIMIHKKMKFSKGARSESVHS